MNQKTILQISGMNCTKYGEVERFFIDLVRLSGRMKYRSILQYESLPVSKSYLRDLEVLGARVVVCPMNNNPFIVCWKIARLITVFRPDIIHVHFVERFGLLFIPLIGRMFGVKNIINTVHYKRWGRNNFVRFAYNMYDSVLACSAAVKTDLVDRGVNSKIIAVQYLGVSSKNVISQESRISLREEFGIPMSAIVFACIAFDTEFKGLDIMLHALSKIVLKHEQIHFISIGVDPKQSKLPELANQLGLSQRVHWAGIRDDGWEILNAADIYVQPSRFGEGLSLSILEAMSMKLPVVCTKVAGNGEAIIDGLNGVLAEPNDIDSLAKALDYIIIQRPKWNDFGRAGYNRYCEFFQGEKLRNDLVNKYYQ